MRSAIQIVEKMMANDAMSQWLGIRIESVAPGNVILKLTVREEMMNGFGIAHGGITYALSDTCIAFSSNAHGRHAVSVETSISHLKPVNLGDTLSTQVEELSLSNKFSKYQIKVINQKSELVSIFNGTMYRKTAHWD